MSQASSEGHAADRRRNERQMAIFRYARISYGDTDQLCLVRNMSETGVLIETMDLPALDRVSVELSPLDGREATVRWRRGSQIGLELADPVSMATLLRPLGEGGGSPARSPRFKRQATIAVIEGSRTINAILENISIGGACLRIEGHHPTELLIKIPNFAAIWTHTR